MSIAVLFSMALGFGGGLGLPLGMPPGEEDPLVAAVAPDECVFYTSWAGMAEPDPDSGNRVEQMIAEPEIQFFFTELQRQIKRSIVAAAKQEDPDGDSSEIEKLVEDASGWIKTVLTHPAAIFLSGPDQNRRKVEIRMFFPHFQATTDL